MGMFFSNIHIKKNGRFNRDILEEVFVRYMTEHNYQLVPDQESADISLKFYAPEESNWVSVCAEIIDFSDAASTEEIISPLSDALETDVLAIACFDSDYLFLHLMNNMDKTNAWANVGINPAGRVPRRTAVGAWGKKVKDIDVFRKIIKDKYVFVEESLSSLAAMLDMTETQSTFSMDSPTETEDHIQMMYFSLPPNQNREKPVLTIPRYGLAPCKKGEPFCESVVNKGGASKGLAILFAGNYVENDEIIFADVCLEYGYEKNTKRIPITLEKRQTTDGKWVYYWEDPSFPIPEKVNQSLPALKVMKEEFKRELRIRFTPFGNTRKFLDICIYFIPLDNYFEGQCCWCVWHYDGSKEAYIKRHNAGWSKIQEDAVLDMQDYDLD